MAIRSCATVLLTVTSRNTGRRSGRSQTVVGVQYGESFHRNDPQLEGRFNARPTALAGAAVLRSSYPAAAAAGRFHRRILSPRNYCSRWTAPRVGGHEPARPRHYCRSGGFICVTGPNYPVKRSTVSTREVFEPLRYCIRSIPEKRDSSRGASHVAAGPPAQVSQGKRVAGGGGLRMADSRRESPVGRRRVSRFSLPAAASVLAIGLGLSGAVPTEKSAAAGSPGMTRSYVVTYFYGVISPNSEKDDCPKGFAKAPDPADYFKDLTPTQLHDLESSGDQRGRLAYLMDHRGPGG